MAQGVFPGTTQSIYTAPSTQLGVFQVVSPGVHDLYRDAVSLPPRLLYWQKRNTSEVKNQCIMEEEVVTYFTCSEHCSGTPVLFRNTGGYARFRKEADRRLATGSCGNSGAGTILFMDADIGIVIYIHSC